MCIRDSISTVQIDSAVSSPPSSTPLAQHKVCCHGNQVSHYIIESPRCTRFVGCTWLLTAVCQSSMFHSFSFEINKLSNLVKRSTVELHLSKSVLGN